MFNEYLVMVYISNYSRRYREILARNLENSRQACVAAMCGGAQEDSEIIKGRYEKKRGNLEVFDNFHKSLKFYKSVIFHA